MLELKLEAHLKCGENTRALGFRIEPDRGEEFNRTMLRELIRSITYSIHEETGMDYAKLNPIY